MSRITYIIIIIVGLLLIGGGVWLLFYSQQEGGTSLPAPLDRLFPEGEEKPNGNTTDSTNTTPEEGGSDNSSNNIGSGQESFERFTQLYDRPVAGYTVLENSGREIVRFIEKESGHVFDYDIETNSLTKISNQTMPGISDVVWSSDGSSFIVRYYNNEEDTIKTTRLSFEGGASDTSNALFTFTNDLSLGDRGEGPLFLQKTLNEDPNTQVSANGPGSRGQETELYGALTENAVQRFQEKYREDTYEKDGLSSPNGVVSGATRDKINEINTQIFTPQDPDISITQLKETNLNNIVEVATNKKRDKIFYLRKEDGSNNGYVSQFNGGNETLITENTLSIWHLTWPKETTLSFQTKSSGKIEGHLYFVDTQTGNEDLILSEKGLTSAANSDTSLVFYSYEDARRTTSAIYDTKEDTSYPLSLSTFADKCVWGNQDTTTLFCLVPQTISGEIFPDSWYQGKTSFSDTVWFINSESQEEQVLFINEQSRRGITFDGTDVFLNGSDSRVYFKDKTTDTLWSLTLGS